MRHAPELIILGRVATLAGDAGLGWVQAVAIAGGRVLATGALHDVAALAGPATETWRLPLELCVMPGITDAHLHLADAAISATELSLEDAPDRPAIAERIRAAHARMAAQGDADGWLLGAGWSIDRWGGWPTADELDALAPGRPSALWTHDHHSLWASRSALTAAKVGRHTADPDGGFLRRDEAGEPTGLLHEHAGKLLTAAIPIPTQDDFVRAIRGYAAMLLGLGVVAVHDPCEMDPDPSLARGPLLYAEMAAAGALALRVAGSIRSEQLPRAIELGLRSGQSPSVADHADPGSVRWAERARMGWLKLFADGALGSRSAALLDPYEREAGEGPVGGPRGMLLEPAAVLAEHARQAAAAGIAVQIHGIGDAAVRAALDILGSLPPHPGGILHRVEHAQLVHPDDVPRFASLGVAASVQPCHLASDRELVFAAWGARSASAFPLRSLADAGAALVVGTDAPVEPPDPWTNLAIAVTRASSRWPDASPFHPEQALGLDRVLRAACSEPALVAGETDRGRLVAGHRADLIVIPAGALDEAPTRGSLLESVRPRATLVDGEVAYRDPGFDP